jgi:DNA-binding CsgD family transcriptional regulator
MLKRLSKPISNELFEGVQECMPSGEENEATVEFDDLISLIAESCVVLDFQQKNFHYVSKHDMFLRGNPPEKIKAMGYAFFQEIIHPDDLPLWIEIYNAIVKCCTNEIIEIDMINYFAYTHRIKSFLSSDAQPVHFMAYVKLKPVFQNGILRFGLCLLSSSVVPKAGNLCVYYTSRDYAEYSFKTKKWKPALHVSLSKREKEILVLFQQGLSQKEMADNMYISEKTIENIKYNLFRKLGVCNAPQALQYASNRQMLFHSHTLSKEDRKKSYKHPLPKKKNKKRLSESDLRHIQAELDKRITVNAISKKTEIPESTVRFNVKAGKLKKKPTSDSQ